MDNAGVRKSHRGKSGKVNGVLLGDRAINSARQALVSVAEETGVLNPSESVGDYLGSQVDGPDCVTHMFDAEVPGYRGWQWIAVLASVPGDDHVTVSEAALVPSQGALRAPAWVPYHERILPGDLQPGDLLPPADDDKRLSRLSSADDTASRKLTDWGKQDAKSRWRTGSYGPNSEFAEKALLHCKSCAFFVPLAHEWGRDFGACINEYSADGRVVHRAFGCGAHSQTPPARGAGSPEAQAWDDTGFSDQTL